MSQKIPAAYQTLASFIFLSIFLWLLFNVLKFLWTKASLLEQQVPIQILIFIASAFVSLVAILLKNNNDLKIQIRNEQREKKFELYEKFTDFYLKKMIFSIIQGQSPPSEKEIIEFLSEHTPQLILWGSDKVIKEFFQFRDNSVNIDKFKENKQTLIFKFEDLLLAMRQDLGHSNTELQKGMLLGLFINDISSYIEKGNSI